MADARRSKNSSKRVQKERQLAKESLRHTEEPTMDADRFVTREEALISNHEGRIARNENELERLDDARLNAHERAAAAEARFADLSKWNEGLQAFVGKLQMADAAERAALLQCPDASWRRLTRHGSAAASRRRLTTPPRCLPWR